MNQLPLSDSCLLSFSFTEQTLTYFYVGPVEIKAKTIWTLLTLLSLFLFFFCFPSCSFFLLGDDRRESAFCCLLIDDLRQTSDGLFKTRICCSKLPGEFTREQSLDRNALFSYSFGPDSCLAILIFGSEGSEALFKGLAAVRTLCLSSDDHAGLVLHPSRGRLQTYTGSPVLGKPLMKPPPTAVSNCHYYCMR